MKRALPYAAAAMTWWTVPFLFGVGLALVAGTPRGMDSVRKLAAVVLLLAGVNAVTGIFLLLYGAGAAPFPMVLTPVVLQCAATLAVMPQALPMPLAMMPALAAALAVATVCVSRPSVPG